MSDNQPAPGEGQQPQSQETNPPPQQSPPPSPPQPAPQPQHKYSQDTTDIGSFFTNLGNQLSALPEQVANAVGERFPKPPDPPKATESVQKKSGTRFSRWYFGDKS